MRPLGSYLESLAQVTLEFGSNPWKPSGTLMIGPQVALRANNLWKDWVMDAKEFAISMDIQAKTESEWESKVEEHLEEGYHLSQVMSERSSWGVALMHHPKTGTIVHIEWGEQE